MPTSRVVRRMNTPSGLNYKLCLDRNTPVEVPLPARGCRKCEGQAFPYVLTGQGATCTGKMAAGKCATDDTSEVGVGPRTATYIPPALHQRLELDPGHTGGHQAPGRGQHQCLQDTGGTLISQKLECRTLTPSD